MVQAILVSHLVGSLHCCACTDCSCFDSYSMLLLLVVPSLPPAVSLSAIAASFSTIRNTSTPRPIPNFRLRVSRVPLPLNHTFPSGMSSPSLYRHPLTNSSTHFTTQPTHKGSRQESPNTVAHAYFSVFALARQPWTRVSSGRACMYVPFPIVFLF